jgi:hypothetical protein
MASKQNSGWVLPVIEGIRYIEITSIAIIDLRVQNSRFRVSAFILFRSFYFIPNFKFF